MADVLYARQHQCSAKKERSSCSTRDNGSARCRVQSSRPRGWLYAMANDKGRDCLVWDVTEHVEHIPLKRRREAKK